MDIDPLKLPDFAMPYSPNTSLNLDWAVMTEGVAQVMADIVFKTWADGGASAAVSATKAVSRLRPEQSASEKVFRIVTMSFAWSIGQSISNYVVEKEYVSESIQKSIAHARAEDNVNKDVAGPNFLKKPRNSPLYLALKSCFVSQMMLVLKDIGYDQSVLENRIDLSFDRGIHEIWSMSPSIYVDLSSIFDSPFKEISESVLNWQSYRQELISQFEVKTIFGQEREGISLSQLYVPLRGYWKDSSEEDEHHNQISPGHPNARAIMLEEHIDDWLNSESDNSWLKLIGGGPGSGKSTTLKSIASKYAKNESWRPLFIPLQHIGIDGDLRDKINKYFTERSGSPFTQEPLSRPSIEGGAPLILIFDGLDEISAPNENANDVVQSFTGQLTSLVGSIMGNREKTIKVIVSGRLPSFQSAKRFLPIKKDTAIEVWGYTSPYLSETNGIDELWSLDQRPIWWSKYLSAKSNVKSELPEALTSDLLKTISHEPLLCYLLALSEYTGENWQEAADNTNLIYRSLIQSVYEREWGDGPQKRLGPGRSLTAHEFNKLMQTFGLAAWLGGDARVASETSFHSTLKLTQGQAAWEAFKRDNGPDMNNLAMNFYLKSSELTHRGFEFTHKSFGEYLASRELVEFSLSLSDFIERSIDLAIQEWFKATKTGILGYEIFGFIKNEFRLIDEDNIDILKSAKSSFEKLALHMINHGSIPQGSTDFRATAINNNNAEIAIWAVLSGVTSRLNEFSNGADYISIEWPSRLSLNSLIQRHTNLDFLSTTPTDCMSYLNASGQYFFSVMIWSTVFKKTNFSDCNFDSCNISDCSFEGVDFSGASFAECVMQSCELTKCNADQLSISRSDVSGFKFSHNEMSGFIIDVDTIVQSSEKNFTDIPNLSIKKHRNSQGEYHEWSDIKADVLERITILDRYFSNSHVHESSR